MTLLQLMQKLRSKGLKGVLARLDPWRAFYRRKYVSDSMTLRSNLLAGLSNIWCGREESVNAIRSGMIQDTLDQARKRIPYYGGLFKRLIITNPCPEDLVKLPLLDKPMVRKCHHALCLPGWQKHVHYRMNTGGSTGQPLEFIVDSLAGVAAAVHQEFAFRLMGFRDGDRIAAFSGISIPDDLRSNNVYWAPRAQPTELAYGSVCYATHYMDSQTLPHYFKSLNQAGFSFFLGYPSAIHSLALYCLEKSVCFSKPIKAVQLTSEVILGSQISDIEKAFQTKVYLQYGMSEVAIYAHTFDSSHEYLCSPLMGHVEVLDETGRHVDPGEEGEIILTGFHNKLMPFLRYCPGDRAIYGGERGGMVVLKKVLGRSQDFIVRADGTRISLTGLVFGQHFKAFGRIARWQIFQDEPGKCTIQIIPLIEFRDEDREEIMGKFWRLAGVAVTIRTVTEIPLTQRGKHLFLIQKIV